MGWFKVDDHYFEHYKVLEAGPSAADLNLRGIAYCSRNQTDGKIPFAAVALLAPGVDTTNDVDALLDAGLWKKTAKHYIIHDYLDHQSSRDQIRAKQQGNRDRKRKSRDRHAQVTATSQRDTPDMSRPGHENVRAPDTETDVEADTDVDRITPGEELRSLTAPPSTAVEELLPADDEVDPAQVRELFAGIGRAA